MTGNYSLPYKNRRLVSFYRDLCKRGREALKHGSVTISPYLKNLSQDKRRGLTLIVRPSSDVGLAMEEELHRLDSAVPNLLFCYNRKRFHFTILSLIDARKDYSPDEYVVRAFEEMIGKVVVKYLPFSVQFHGICATENSIIAKGFPLEDKLELLRDELRNILKKIGLGGDIDRRYRIKGAHVTLARFRERGDFNKLKTLLRKLDAKPLGNTTVTQLQLVCNDFYMSPRKVRTLAQLPKPSGEVIHNLPGASLEFVGRSAEIAEVLQLLSRPKGHVVIVSGFGGTGKSELAKRIAWQCVESKFPFEFICWINVRSYTGKDLSLLDILDIVARTAGLQSYVPATVGLDEKKTHIKSILEAQKSLLVIDNYEDLLAKPKVEADLASFIKSLVTRPGPNYETGGVRILITTREDQHPWNVPCRRLMLAGLPFKDTCRLIDSPQWHPFKLRPDQIRRLWQAVDGLPKLIVVAIELLRKGAEFKGIILALKGVSNKQNDLAGALFEHAWKNLLSDDMKHILMALTHFVDEAKPKALCAVSGVDNQSFWRELTRTYGAYINSTGTGYTAHPLALKFYTTMLQMDSHFHMESGKRFAKYFAALVNRQDIDSMEKEIRNITAASRLFDLLAKQVPRGESKGFRQDLVQLVESASDFLWIRGYWEDYLYMAELGRIAAQNAGEIRHEAQFLVRYLGWLALRREDIVQAEMYIKQGLKLYEKLDDIEGIALAKRHLGKLALLKGLHPDYYIPGNDWEKWARQALKLYNESLKLRKLLEEKVTNQLEAIADLQLDLGRLHWLDGQYYHQQQFALEKYMLSYKTSKIALENFRKLGITRGKAKAWGNCGNAARQIAKFHASDSQQEQAGHWIRRARELYTKSLQLAKSIMRRDEIAHAYWGLAESIVLWDNISGRQQARELLSIAHRFAQAAHDLYKMVGGPRDIRSTNALLDEIRTRLKSLDAKSPIYFRNCTGTETHNN